MIVDSCVLLSSLSQGGDAGGICQIEALLKFARYLAKQKVPLVLTITVVQCVRSVCHVYAYTHVENGEGSRDTSEDPED